MCKCFWKGATWWISKVIATLNFWTMKHKYGWTKQDIPKNKWDTNAVETLCIIYIYIYITCIWWLPNLFYSYLLNKRLFSNVTLFCTIFSFSNYTFLCKKIHISTSKVCWTCFKCTRSIEYTSLRKFHVFKLSTQKNIEHNSRSNTYLIRLRHNLKSICVSQLSKCKYITATKW